MVPIAVLLALSPSRGPGSPGSEISLRCTAGEVTVQTRDGAGPEAGTTVAPGAVALPVPCPFSFSAGAGSRFEASCGDLRLTLSGPCEGVVAAEGSGFGLLLTAAGGWRVATAKTPFVLALGGRLSVRAGKGVSEGTFTPGSGVELANLSGEPLRIYRDGRMVDLLPESLRTRISQASLGPDSPPVPRGPDAPRSYRWGTRSYVLPPGVLPRVERGRLILEGAESLSGSAVVVLERRFVLIRAGGVVEIGPAGVILEVRGPAKALRALGAGDPSRSGFPGSPGIDPTQTGVVLSPAGP
ncbi:MAG: hypothetical protein L0323_15760 [Planctomycetes bacterium]|nr:hypothetical protein [Planctomycetota bacterium]